MTCEEKKVARENVHHFQSSKIDIIFQNEQLSNSRFGTMQRIKDEIQLSLQMFSGDPYYELKIYGSALNGFGVQHSDLDLSLTYNGTGVPRMPVGHDVFHMIVNAVKCNPRLSNSAILEVRNTRVPIIKLFHRPSQLSVDISVFNQFALDNTNLLATYASIDERARKLGVYFKHWIRQHMPGLNRRRLSSYSIIVMLIHYLQRCQPPVLPVLEEVPESNLPDLTKSWSKNKRSVAELWIGFMEYYAGMFDFKNFVVQIRQSASMPKTHKKWDHQVMAIEDPCELSHNLGDRVDAAMLNTIVQSFAFEQSKFQQWTQQVNGIETPQKEPVKVPVPPSLIVFSELRLYQFPPPPPPSPSPPQFFPQNYSPPKANGCTYECSTTSPSSVTPVVAHPASPPFRSVRNPFIVNLREKALRGRQHCWLCLFRMYHTYCAV